MMIRLLSLVALVGALACVAGCDGSPAGRCDSIYSKLEQQPEFKQSGMSRYGNEFRAAFTEACADMDCDVETTVAGCASKHDENEALSWCASTAR